jgi:hypothetical protein
MADQPTDKQLKASFQLYQSLLEGFWAHWKTVQKGTNDHRELARQTIIASLQLAAVVAVDISQDPERVKAQFDELYRQAYAKAPKFG